MGWRYEWVAALPADVYDELVALLQAETRAGAGAPAEDPIRG